MALDQAERDRLRERFVDYRRTGERAIRDELIESHLRLAEHLARRFANRGVALDDLIQVASLGLVKAVERFEPERGLEFSTFATPTIMGELKRHFRDKGWSVRVPRRVQELHVELNTLIAELTQRLGRSPTIHELANGARTSDEEVLEAVEAAQAYRSTSIDAPLGSGDDDTRGLANQLGNEDANLFDAENRLVLEGLLSALPIARATDVAPPVLRRHDPESDRRPARYQSDACVATPQQELAHPAGASRIQTGVVAS